ncbi:MAG: bifunctional 4-hydroxy-2-oxoglutarate aldolase/2-dehydro-3-deoxy-phosphogluconate aldolase [Pseudomonadota bacterium]
MDGIDHIMRAAPVIPVLVIDDVAQAGPLAEALVAGGLTQLEVTLRTPCALEAIAEMSAVAGAVVGAGTVLNETQLEDVARAGAKFVVSPGLTAPLAKAAADMQMPFLPGVANAGDIMRGLDLGLSHFKFFPAVASGGLPALKALSAPFHSCQFCPTGGITLASAPDWLAQRSVLCVGGSWIVPKGPLALDQVRANAAAAAALTR